MIVFNPVYPTVFAELEEGTMTRSRPAHSITWDSLRPRYDFVVVDCQDIHIWGGTDYDWTNATHVDRVQLRRMLRYIATHADGALTERL